MKRNRNTKKTFSARSNVSSRAKRQMMKNELLRLAEQAGVSVSGAKVRLGGDVTGGGSLARGVLHESSSGFCFVSSEDYSSGDIFVPAAKRGEAIGGDTVEVSFHEYRDRDGRLRTEGRVVSVIIPRADTVVGTVYEDIRYIHRKRVRTLTLLPDDSHIKREITLIGEAEQGDKALVRIKRPKSHGAPLLGEVLDIFGKAGDPEASYASILAECGIVTEFTEEERRQAKSVLDMPVSDDGRRRFGGVVFTIDSEWAKDLDDAIAIRRTRGGYILYVHIADVSHYVKEKTALDRLVMARGTSVYFTDKVVPMLPPELSEQVCSLHPGADKYTLSAEISLSEDGEIRSAELYKGIINSTVKGVYSEINQIFSDAASPEIMNKYKRIIPSLRTMHELYLKLLKRSENRGALELETAEVYIPLDENGAPCDIVKQQRGDAERMIEQFMLTANEAVATLLTKKGIPLVYRVHEQPPSDKLSGLADFLTGLGIDASRLRGDTVKTADLTAILDKAKELSVSEAVSYTVLRAMSKAKYSEIHRPHFGLAIDTYCHFTSPIRRLSDLATHRIITRVLIEGGEPLRYRSYAKRAAAAATEGELRAVSAERRIEALYKVIYMKERVGEEFDAVVSGVSSHGLFVTPENTCEGLVPLSDFEWGFVFNERTVSISRGLTSYKIGTRVRVRLEEADISLVRLRYSLVNEQ